MQHNVHKFPLLSNRYRSGDRGRGISKYNSILRDPTKSVTFRYSTCPHSVDADGESTLVHPFNPEHGNESAINPVVIFARKLSGPWCGITTFLHPILLLRCSAFTTILTSQIHSGAVPLQTAVGQCRSVI